jgi:hypothetical protein
MIFNGNKRLLGRFAASHPLPGMRNAILKVVVHSQNKGVEKIVACSHVDVNEGRLDPGRNRQAELESPLVEQSTLPTRSACGHK